ncbi:hypothetical protein C8J57DRAFT_1235918 [Mycena rebaudengoi]|nr:hypothetical protein C8J57DRAFT_1235918 [Mycena rebaudengoi]
MQLVTPTGISKGVLDLDLEATHEDGCCTEEATQERSTGTNSIRRGSSIRKGGHVGGEEKQCEEAAGVWGAGGTRNGKTKMSRSTATCTQSVERSVGWGVQVCGAGWQSGGGEGGLQKEERRGGAGPRTAWRRFSIFLQQNSHVGSISKGLHTTRTWRTLAGKMIKTEIVEHVPPASEPASGCIGATVNDVRQSPAHSAARR